MKLKVFSRFVLLSLILHLIQSECTEKGHAGLESKCSTTDDCFENLFCNSGICSRDNTQSTCNRNSDCFGNYCNKENNCDTLKFNGESCSEDDECHSKSCSGGECKGSYYKTQQYEPLDRYNCESGSFLPSDPQSICIEQLDKNDDCNEYLDNETSQWDIACKPGFVCGQTAKGPFGKCRKMYSAKKQEQCEINNHCKAGLICKDSKCTEISKKEACTNDNDCPTNFYCNCGGDRQGTCKKISNSFCTEQVDGFVNCLQDSKCDPSLKIGPGNCLYKKCFEEIQEMQCCQMMNHLETYFPLAGMVCSEIDPQLASTNRNLLIALSVIIPIAAVFAALVLYCRIKRKRLEKRKKRKLVHGTSSATSEQENINLSLNSDLSVELED
ncbi:dd-gdca protein [Anaeramoeba flamelloides]|uniref:Dd-gdca protein n=1 Tax=Anaeramoeba flamelloides TaxID=1746091 RepID=A0AAV8A5Z7_9EUKA|nr:dd-gdca protein [Anaeramoeba flamelloides]